MANVKIRIYLFSAVLLLVLAFCTGCGKQEHDGTLVRVSQIVSRDPEGALRLLDSVDYSNLSAQDRHFHDFLTVKARDKGYICHESDSLILDVIDHYSQNPEDSLYAEALYYGGRVYSDIGDYPSALEYYQTARENVTLSSGNSDLNVRISSQIGILLQKLRLYNEAEPYFTDVLNQKIKDNDTVGIVYTLQRLGGIAKGQNNLYEADSILTRSLDYSTSLPVSYGAMSKVLLSSVKRDQGDLKLALSLVRNTPEQVNPVSRNVALAYAANIYLLAGITDTAYIYAHELVESMDKTNKKTGYEILLSDTMRSRIDSDSLDRYFADYRGILEDFFDDNSTQMAIIQEGVYNYRIQEREKDKAHRSNVRLRFVLFWSLFAVVVLFFVILYLRYRNKTNVIKLKTAIDNLNLMKLDMEKSLVSDTPVELHLENFQTLPLDSEKELRERLNREIKELEEKSARYSIPESILKSEAYTETQKLLKSSTPINGRLWQELKEEVLRTSPHFISNLQVLSKNNLSKSEEEVAILVKCGFLPVEMEVLLARSNGAVISRRKSLGRKIFGKELGVSTVDNLIRLL